MKFILILLFGLAVLLPIKVSAEEHGAAIDTVSDVASVDELLDRLAIASDEEEASLLAEEIWARFLNSGSASVDLLLQRGMEVQAMGELDLAGDFFADVVEFAPEFAEGWNQRAKLEYMRGEYVAAMEDLGRAIELQPRHFGARTGLGLVLERLGSPEGAYQAYLDALAIHPFLDEAQAGIKRLEKQVKGRAL